MGSFDAFGWRSQCYNSESFRGDWISCTGVHLDSRCTGVTSSFCDSKTITGFALSHYEGNRHTVYFKNQLYTEAPRMESKRMSHGGQGPVRKIRKIVHMTPDAGQLLKFRDVAEGRLHVRLDGDRVFVTVRAEPYHVDHVMNIPRNETRPKPIRPAGR